MTSLLFILGLAAIVVGAGMVYLPAGVITAGCLTVLTIGAAERSA